MPTAAPSTDRPQSTGEEIANSVSHGVGFVLALVAVPVLVVHAVPHGAAAVVGASVFGATLTLLYLFSTLYHATPLSRAKRVFLVLDHVAIYLLIAGTYTPFTLGVLRGSWGWTLFGIIWALAVTGIVFKSVFGMRHGRLSTAVYLAMGWLIVVAVRPLWLHMAPWGMFWLLAGGVAYTLGVAFYASRQLRYAHFLWHLAVLAGSVCHFVAVLGYST